MKKKLLAIVVVVVLCLSVACGTLAAYMATARMQVFEGRIEQRPESKLILSTADGVLGDEGSFGWGETLSFPVLGNGIAPQELSDDTIVWTDEAGNSGIAAPTFTLTADGADAKNVWYHIELNGDTSAATALRFGVTTVRHYEDSVVKHITEIDRSSITGSYAQSVVCPLGDIPAGGSVDIQMSVWVDSTALSELESYTSDAFSVAVIFTSTDDPIDNSPKMGEG